MNNGNTNRASTTPQNTIWTSIRHPLRDTSGYDAHHPLGCTSPELPVVPPRLGPVNPCCRRCFTIPAGGGSGSLPAVVHDPGWRCFTIPAGGGSGSLLAESAEVAPSVPPLRQEGSWVGRPPESARGPGQRPDREPDRTIRAPIDDERLLP